MIKVLLIEDEVKLVQSLKRGLSENDISVDFSSDGLAGYTMAEQGDYDVIITDIIMPGIDGMELVKKLRNQIIKTPILMITALGDIDDKVNGLDAGADDYLVKPFAFKELLARIKALYRRSQNNEMKNEILRFEDLELNLERREAWRDGQNIDLTPKEFALMEYFMRHQGRVISKTEIAEKVWDINFDTNTNVIEVYISYLRNKVDKPFSKKLIHTLFGSGYILRSD